MKTARIHSPFDCQNYGIRKGHYRRLTRQAHLEEVTFPTSLANRWKKLRDSQKSRAGA
jgi:hypothetical protein